MHPLTIDENTPTNDIVFEYCQKTTLIKARVQDTINFLEKKRIKNLNKDVFCKNSISHTTRY